MAIQEATLRRLADVLQSRRQRIVTAESCTGGLVASHLTAIPGSSKWFLGAFVTYTPATKTAMLGIPAELLRDYGAVSEHVAKLMARNALERTAADLSVAVTGLAGPEGDGSNNPIGTVWIGLAARAPQMTRAQPYHLAGNRAEIREAAAFLALDTLLAAALATESP